MIATLAGCSGPSARQQPDEPVANTEQGFSNFGMERAIPLRFVMMANNCNSPQPYSGCAHTPPTQTVCSTCSDGTTTNCGPDTVSIAEIKDSVEKANFALRAAGVQLWVERIEKYLMPTFWVSDDGAQKPKWSDVWGQFHGPYPQVTSTWPFDPIQEFKEKKWGHAVTIRAGNPQEIIIFVAECSMGGDGVRVFGGASSFVADREIIESARAFTHEIGHILGLEHTMFHTEPWETPNTEDLPDEPGGGGTAVWTDPANYWDLTYGKIPGTGQIWYPSNFTEAWNWQHPPDGGVGQPLYSKMTWDPAPSGVNCALDTTTCIPSCCVGSAHPPGGAADKPLNGQCSSGQFETIGTAGIKGLGFTFNSGLYGPNAMGYWNPGGALDTCPWSSFSESQAAQVRRTLRSDTRIADSEVGAPYASGYTSQRFRLGDWRNRTGFEQLDFDGDGKQDIALWQPPGTPGAGATVGRFRALLSANNYTTTLERDFGQLGDVPVPADYDGDGKTDFAVIRRGGLTGQSPTDALLWWIWCPSSSGSACPAQNTCTWPTNCLQWGDAADVPLPGLEMDGTTAAREVAIYRPSNRYLYWIAVNQSGSGNFYTRFESPIVLLPGLYDTDGKSDIAAYNPQNARFALLRSMSSWNYASATERYFDVVLRPNANAATDAGFSAPAVRHGGVAIAPRANGKQGLSVWDPYTGTWYTNWDPVNSATIQSCPWGAARDVPLGGLDQDQNGYSDLAVFRATSQTVYLKNSTCSGATYSFSIPTASARSVIGTVPDMKGSDDGVRDILLFDPDTMTWYRYYSQWNAPFVGQPAINFGAVGAVAL